MRHCNSTSTVVGYHAERARVTPQIECLPAFGLAGPEDSSNWPDPPSPVETEQGMLRILDRSVYSLFSSSSANGLGGSSLSTISQGEWSDKRAYHTTERLESR